MADNIQFNGKRPKDKVMLGKLNACAPYKYLDPTTLARQLLSEKLDELVEELGVEVDYNSSTQPAGTG